MKRRVLKVAIIAMLLVLVYTTIVSAYSYIVTITPSSTTVAESTEFNVKVSVSNLDVGTNGINALSGYLKYDDEVFETISASSIEGAKGWSLQGYDTEKGKVTFAKTTFVKSDEDVFNIAFKTKAGTSGKSGIISFTQIQASNSEGEISATDVSTTITVGTASENVANAANSNSNAIRANITANTSGNSITANVTNANTNAIKTNTNTTNTNTRTNANTNSNTNTNSISSYVNAMNSTTDDIPYTGVEDTVMYIIFGVIVIAAISYIRFERINKDLRK